MKCWKNNCKGQVGFICRCTKPPIYLCGQHIPEHLQAASGTEHKLESQTFLPNPETKNALIDHIHNSLTNLYEFRRKTVSDLSMQIKLLNEKLEIILDSFEEIIQRHVTMISKIFSLENTSELDNNKINEILALPPAESIQKLEEILDIFDKENLIIDDSGRISKRISIRKSKGETNQIVVFRNYTMKIVKTNLNDYTSSEFNISLDNNKTMHVGMCSIPDNSIFIYGDYPLNTAFIIDSNNNSSQVKNGPVALTACSSIYYKNYVYIFGGCNGSAILANAFKYDLKNNNWTNLSSLPAPSQYPSCIGRKNRILLSGYHHSKIYCYDITQNRYTELHNVRVGLFKVVCGNENNYYVIEMNGNIYESNQEWKVWSTIGNSGIENIYQTGSKALWKNKVYFANFNYNLYEFDLKEKKIKLVKKI